MSVCDAHEAVTGSKKAMTAGEGYLFAARYMQRSVIQEKFLDGAMAMMAAMGISREECRQHAEQIQGSTPWLVCEECFALLNLS